MSAPESLPWGSSPVRRGDVLADKYRVDRVLGVGGMGIVVAATHLHLDQKVALKFMLPSAIANAALVERFSREARAAVRLKSDHVARVLDVGTLPWGAPFMVMEYLDGQDLGSIVGHNGPMSVEAAVDSVLQACDAVAEAHSLGIVHRDLKPRNLFLTQRNDGRALVKVLDFGIAKHLHAADLALTGTTEVIGSPYYMSPEQLKSSRAATPQSDIWSLGVILYELLTGQVPFVAEGVTALTLMVLQEPHKPVDLVRPGVPRGLGAVVTRCLQKQPEDRFASIADLAAALEPFAPADSRDLAARISRIGAGSKPPGAPLIPTSSARIAVSGNTSVNWAERTEIATGSRTRATWIAAVLGIAALCALGGFLLAGRTGRREPPATAEIPPVPGAPPSVAIAPLDVPSGQASPSAAPSVSTTTPVGPDAGATGRPAPRAVPAPTGSGDAPPRYRTSW